MLTCGALSRAGGSCRPHRAASLRVRPALSSSKTAQEVRAWTLGWILPTRGPTAMSGLVLSRRVGGSYGHLVPVGGRRPETMQVGPPPESHPAPLVSAMVVGPCSDETLGCSRALLPSPAATLCLIPFTYGDRVPAWEAWEGSAGGVVCSSPIVKAVWWLDSQLLPCDLGLVGVWTWSSCCSSRGVAGGRGGRGQPKSSRGCPPASAHHFQGWVTVPHPPLTKQRAERRSVLQMRE